jgi:hypothetical protein
MRKLEAEKNMLCSARRRMVHDERSEEEAIDELNRSYIW